MQKWQDQAEKNNLVISEKGDCQLCGSRTNGGIAECVEKAGYITTRESRINDTTQISIFLCVDAHALQHAEIHGRWNNHFHLSRLHLILQDKIVWEYKYSVLLSEILKSYKEIKPNEIIASPNRKKRGEITVTDIEGHSSDEQYLKMVTHWATSVFDSYSEGHDIAKEIANLFKQKIY